MRMIFFCCMCKVDMPDIAENIDAEGSPEQLQKAGTESGKSSAHMEA